MCLRTCSFIWFCFTGKHRKVSSTFITDNLNFNLDIMMQMLHITYLFYCHSSSPVSEDALLNDNESYFCKFYWKMNYFDVSYELILFDNALLYSHYVNILIFRRVTFQSMYKHNKALKLIYSYVTKYFRFITKRVSE